MTPEQSRALAAHVLDPNCTVCGEPYDGHGSVGTCPGWTPAGTATEQALARALLEALSRAEKAERLYADCKAALDRENKTADECAEEACRFAAQRDAALTQLREARELLGKHMPSGAAAFFARWREEP